MDYEVHTYSIYIFTEGHSKYHIHRQDQTLLVQIETMYIGFCVYRLSYEIFTRVPRNNVDIFTLSFSPL